MSCRGGHFTSNEASSPEPHTLPIYSKSRSNSKVSVKSGGSSRSRKEYLDSLIPPTKEEFRRIEMAQIQKEEEILRKRMDMSDEQIRAAGLIQRNYRGYRARRKMRGMALDPGMRLVDVVREAKFRNLFIPKARSSYDDMASELDVIEDHINGGGQANPSFARQNWRKLVSVTKWAIKDEDSDVLTDDDEDDVSEEVREQRHRRRAEQKAQRQQEARILDLQYWLEMVDLQHRYGSNLRVYHTEWQKADTNENFFYWLDQGAGRLIDCQGCPRERLCREKVRYLSREERMRYLVKIDKEGRLRWAKNDARIDTTEKYKDSIHGIVPVDDASPPYVRPGEEAGRDLLEGEAGTGSESESTTVTDHKDSGSIRSSKYSTLESDKTPDVKKVKTISASALLDKLLRGSVRKNTWIFVADTSFRLYVGIKQSGSFQHSSFLHGSRISAAGLIKIKDGRLDKLSPLSGHYRPPTSSFRAFISSLREAGADLSHMSISRSYLVLIGLEAYANTRRRGEKLVHALVHGRDRLLTSREHPRQQGRPDTAPRNQTDADRRIKEIRDDALHGRTEADDDKNTVDSGLLSKLWPKAGRRNTLTGNHYPDSRAAGEAASRH